MYNTKQERINTYNSIVEFMMKQIKNTRMGARLRKEHTEQQEKQSFSQLLEGW